MRTLIIAAAASVAMFALATSALAQDAGSTPVEEPAAATEIAPADPAAPSAEAAAPSADQTAAQVADAAAAEPPGRIIFFRPSRLTGAVYTYHVVEVAEDGDSTRDSPRIGSLPNGRYFMYEAPPGIHSYNLRGAMAVNLDEDRLRLEVEPGETYYVEQTVRMGVFTGGFRLVPSTQAEFERRRLREWTPDPSEGESGPTSEQESSSN